MELEYLIKSVIKSRLNLILICTSFALVFLLFIVNLIYKLAVGNKKRFFVVSSFGVIIAMEGAFFMQSPFFLLSVGVPYFIISLGEIIFLRCFLLLISDKKIVVSKAEKSLIKELDEKIAREDNVKKESEDGAMNNDEREDYFFDNPFIKRVQSVAERIGDTEVKTVKPIKKAEEKRERGAVNFSHVKNVIDLLRSYALSPTDRKKVEELAIVLKEEEKSDASFYNEKINGVLETLLILMSKYKTQ